MTEEQFAKLLEELMGKIKDGPGNYGDILTRFAKKHAAFKELQEIIAEINDSMGAFRLILQYLMFDLEATRRERNELYMRLEDQENDPER